MTGQYAQREFGRRWADDIHPLLLAGTAFALGLVAGLLLKGGAKELGDRVRLGKAHRDYERTVTYDENLPDSLGRREPAPHPGQPRYGGTGALGVSPTTASTANSENPTTPKRDNP